MIERNILKDLREWKNRKNHKPLVLRGARQVGKTTVVKQFAKEFDIFIDMNLEIEQEKNLFEQESNGDAKELFLKIKILKNVSKSEGTTLLFIDEIQNSPKAIWMLRYFYETIPELYVITAGSLLESLMGLRRISFPVGRVEYMILRPCCFGEFLQGIHQENDLETLQSLKADIIHERMSIHFRDYLLTGGMPQVITNFYDNERNIIAVQPIFESLLQSYMEDVEKYADTSSKTNTIRYILSHGWNMAGETITFENFAGGKYRSREISEAFDLLSKTMLLELVYPTNNTMLPILPNMRMRPKLLWLDTGLVNYISGIQKDVFNTKNIQDIWRGRIAEHIVAQMMIAENRSILSHHSYWRRNKQGSEAEVDFLLPYDSKLIPIEVKSGHNSKLKSLHLFMKESNLNFAIRVWNQPFSIDEIKQDDKSFRLLNIPFYYCGMLPNIVDKYI